MAWSMVRVVLSLSNAVIAFKLGHNVYSAGGGFTQTKAKYPECVGVLRDVDDGHFYDADDQFTLFREWWP